jgi:predicted DNA-binding transcriptional regulator AlpA
MPSHRELARRQRQREQSYLQAADVRARYGGVSDMWLHRRLKDDSGFPKPVYFGRLRYWSVSALQAWERTCAARS